MSTMIEKTPFVQARQKSIRQRPTSIVVLNSGTTSDTGAALGIANHWHRSKSATGVCHYVVDKSNTYQCVPDGNVADPEQNGHQKGAIRILLCTDFVNTEAEWNTPQNRLVLNRAAKLIAQLAYGYKIPLKQLDESQAAGWYKHRWRRRGGIIVEAKGYWPTELFVFNLDAHFSRIR